MNERRQAEQFNRALDDLLAGKPVEEGQLSAGDRTALQLARQLAGEEFGGALTLRRQLRAELAARAEEQIGRPTRQRRPIQRFQALYRPLVWAGLALALVLLLAWAFRNLTPRPEPAATPVVTQAVGEATETPVEAIGVVPSPTVTSTPDELTPTPEPQVPELGPILTSPGLYSRGWSPDGAWLAYLTQTEEDLLNSPIGEGFLGPAPGAIHFLDTRSGESCQYPQENERGLLFNRWFAWLPDGRLATLTAQGELVALDSPCQEENPAALLADETGPQPIDEVLAASGDNAILLARGASSCWIVDLRQESATPVASCSREASFSPDETYLSVDIDAEPEYRTDVYQVETGEQAGSVAWQFSAGGLGNLPAAEWLDENRFVIFRTDRGPLMVNVSAGFETQPVAPAFFGIEGHAYQYPDILVSPDGEIFHLLLTDLGLEVSGETQLYLYHSENEQVENLSFAEGEFTPGGFLKLLRISNASGSEQYTYRLRPVDPPESEARLVVSPEDQPYPGFSQDGELIARASPSSDQLLDQPAGSRSPVTIAVLGSADGDVRQEWLVGAYTFTFEFSPEDRYLVALGSPLSGGEQALYLLPLR